MIRRLPIILLALLGVMAGSLAPARATDTPLELARYCAALQKRSSGRGQDLRIPSAREPLLCWGYMQAIQDFAALTDEEGRRLLGFCPPPQSRLSDLIQAFLDSAYSRRSDAGANTAVAVIKALQAAFPCPRNGEATKP